MCLSLNWLWWPPAAQLTRKSPITLASQKRSALLDSPHIISASHFLWSAQFADRLASQAFTIACSALRLRPASGHVPYPSSYAGLGSGLWVLLAGWITKANSREVLGPIVQWCSHLVKLWLLVPKEVICRWAPIGALLLSKPEGQ
jgi:hypothetical protein